MTESHEDEFVFDSNEYVDEAEEYKSTFDEKLDEVKQKIESGLYYTPQFLQKDNLLLLRDKERSEYIRLHDLSDEEKEKLLEFARKLAEKVRKEIKEREKVEKRKKTTTQAKHTLEAIDKGYAKIIRNLTEATGWFADVLHDVGFYATLIAMQEAKIPPEQVYDAVVRFKDPAEFSEFVKEHLSALFEAKNDAKALLELREELEELDAKLLVLKEVYRKLKEQRNKLYIMLQYAQAVMCSECMRKYLTNLTAFEITAPAIGGVGDGGSSDKNIG